MNCAYKEQPWDISIPLKDNVRYSCIVAQVQGIQNKVKIKLIPVATAFVEFAPILLFIYPQILNIHTAITMRYIATVVE